MLNRLAHLTSHSSVGPIPSPQNAAWGHLPSDQKTEQEAGFGVSEGCWGALPTAFNPVCGVAVGASGSRENVQGQAGCAACKGYCQEEQNVSPRVRPRPLPLQKQRRAALALSLPAQEPALALLLKERPRISVNKEKILHLFPRFQSFLKAKEKQFPGLGCDGCLFPCPS